ncbi:sensor histidine kinase [Anaerostipes sp.]|uniref:sensor histidine kinase n=1 Tax=Anaerostipes sp. TaxID=1872530 RepID=UPI0025BA76F7|nr:GHKL domain-containing protein [Anaerostipes sp.]MBS7008914.1 sensor histidine kinase [Anaerostipes sp.]
MIIIYFMIQIIGFLLQALPAAFLCLYAFYDSEWHLSKKKTYIGGFSIFLAGAVIFAGMEMLSYMKSGWDIQWIGNISMSVCIVLFGSFFFWNICEEGHKQFFILMLLTHYSAIEYSVSTVLTSSFKFPVHHSIADHMVYSEYTIAIYAVLFLVTFPIMCFFINYIRKHILYRMNSREVKRGCYYGGTALVLYCISMIVLSTRVYSQFRLMEIICFLLTLIFTDITIYFIYFEEIRLAKEKYQLEEQLRTFDGSYKKITAGIEEARRARHDIRHHLNTISMLNRERRYEELDEYLKSYTVSFHKLEDKQICGYATVDGILKYYIDKADKKGIAVKTDLSTIKESYNFDIMDLTVLLGNLMENAIESCEHLDSGESYISITMKKVNVSLLIQVENSCDQKAEEISDFMDESYFSSTKHTRLKGIGLKSMRLIAEKYGGSAEFKRKGGVFTSRFVLNIP